MSNSNKLIIALAAVLVLGSASLSVTAYSAFTADRTASIDVVNDVNGLIQLKAGPSQPFITNTPSGLNIDISRGNAQGLNANAQLDIGKEGSPSTSYAFNLSNAGTQTRDVSLDYNLASDDGNTAINVEFIVYDSTGTKFTTITDENSAKTITVQTSDTYYIVMNINTDGLTKSADLSGTLNITAT